MEGSTVTGRRSALVGVGTGYGAAVIAMPIAALAPSPSMWDVAMAVVATTIAGVVSRLAWRQRSLGWVALGPLLAAAAAVLFDVTPPGVSTIVFAALAGAAAGISGTRLWPAARWVVVGAGAGLFSVVVVRVVSGMSSALTVGVLAAIVAAAATILDGRPARKRGWPIPIGAAVAAIALLAWTGANDPQLSWFGDVVWHGPRDEKRVAITFDDGPNATATLGVRDILDHYGVKATFFLVGKALDARPDIARALLADDMLLGGHSYHHDGWRWLDPRYPELDRTIAAFRRQLDVCPYWYRPPHGQRTPLMSRAITDHHMRDVTWDTSAGDWATNDAGLVAARVLRDAKPGSIILLHDGLDGVVDADRTVILKALPMILDGLRQRGLEPVRLDELLGGPAYVDSC